MDLASLTRIPAAPAGSRLSVILTTLASDSHTWNLVFLQMLLEEMGHRVTNLGPCVPDSLLVGECLRRRPDLVVVSSVNGHGCHDGLRSVRQLRGHPELVATPVVIGGKLGTGGVLDDRFRSQLLAAGFDAVFEDGMSSIGSFRSFVGGLTRPGEGRRRHGHDVDHGIGSAVR